LAVLRNEELPTVNTFLYQIFPGITYSKNFNSCIF